MSREQLNQLNLPPDIVTKDFTARELGVLYILFQPGTTEQKEAHRKNQNSDLVIPSVVEESHTTQLL